MIAAIKGEEKQEGKIVMFPERKKMYREYKPESKDDEPKVVMFPGVGAKTEEKDKAVDEFDDNAPIPFDITVEITSDIPIFMTDEEIAKLPKREQQELKLEAGLIEKNSKTLSLYKSNGVPKPKAAEPIKDPKDVRRLLQYFRDKGEERNRLLVLMGISLCLRCGDLLSIKVGDIRDKNGNIRDRLELYEEKTNKFNCLPITGELKKSLEEYVDVMMEDYDYLFKSRKTNSLGFQKPISISMVDIMLKKAKKDLNLPGNISSHSFRKTGVYHMLKNNQYGRDGELTIQRMLNHSDFSTTLRYCGLMEDTLGEMKSAMSDAIFGEDEPEK